MLRNKGDWATAYPRVIIAVLSASKLGKKLVFVTNNSTKSRKDYAKKFLGFGMTVKEVKT